MGVSQVALQGIEQDYTSILSILRLIQLFSLLKMMKKEFMHSNIYMINMILKSGTKN